MPKVFIIVPVHNRIKHTLKFLESIKNINYKNYQVVIIDDGSTDGSYEEIQNLYPEVILLQGDGNYWWTRSVNSGVKYALENNADYVLTINNDILVEQNFLNALVECAKEYPDSVIGSKVYFNPTEICHGGGKKNLIFPPNFNITPFGKLDNLKYQHIREVDSVAGMGMLVPVSIFKAIGLFDEKNFPHYYADTEFALRAKKAGFKNLFCPDSVIYNNPETTWKYPDEFSKNILKYLLFDKGSGYLLKAHLNLYFKYWPKAVWFIPFCLLYFKCIAGVLKLLFLYFLIKIKKLFY